MKDYLAKAVKSLSSSPKTSPEHSEAGESDDLFDIAKANYKRAKSKDAQEQAFAALIELAKGKD